MLDAGYSVSGFQDTVLAPALQKNGTWHIPANQFQQSETTICQYSLY